MRRLNQPMVRRGKQLLVTAAQLFLALKEELQTDLLRQNHLQGIRLEAYISHLKAIDTKQGYLQKLQEKDALGLIGTLKVKLALL